MPLPLLALAAAPSIVKGLAGIGQIFKGNSMAKNNKRPDYEIPQEFRDNLAMAENMAQVGLPQQQYNNALNNINRAQAGALGVLSRSANPAAGLAAALRQTQGAAMNLDAQDASTRLNNQRFAIGQRGILGQQQLAKQNWDRIGRYQENASAASALKGAGMQNAFGALDGLSQLGLYSGMNGQTQSNTPVSTTNNQLSPLAQAAFGVIPQQIPNRMSIPGINNGLTYGNDFQFNPYMRR